jgi:hypothetical protein
MNLTDQQKEQIKRLKNQNYTPEEILEKVLGITDENFEPEMVFSSVFC